ncbi:MAG: hypothetical protein OXT67_07350 [Zetaproteobacteria bacterium]|nr:hypothetical protein [Zetaproteobacteria bacterium]
MKISFQCHQCGEPQEHLYPISRRETCQNCHADLKVCLNCHFYDQHAQNECRESSAERERCKETGNSCEYFRPAAARNSQCSKQTQDHAMRSLEKFFK